jgi:hypothetical protein
MDKMSQEKVATPVRGIEALPPEIRDRYHEVVSYHHGLLKRLAQK